MKGRNLFLLGCLAAVAACSPSKLKSSSRDSEFADNKLIDGANPDGIGLNLGSLEFSQSACDNPLTCQILGDALAHARTLRARWIRLEFSSGRDLDYWDGVVQRIAIEIPGTSVLGLLNNTLLQRGKGYWVDPGPCGNYSPTDFGSRLVNEWLPVATDWVRRLRARGVQHWEIWNEGNNDPTRVCPENYAFLLTEASIRWLEIETLDVGIGPSTLNFGSTTSASDYLNTLFSNTEKVDSYRQGHGDNPPWTRVYNHPYPCHDDWCGVQGERPSVFLQHQADGIRAVQPRPIWFSELGFQSSDDQANNLLEAYNTALNGGLAEKVFWFSLTDCAGHGPYGLINGCPFGSAPRPSYWAFQSLSTNSVDCHSIAACKFTRAGTGCETTSFECPAIRFSLGWSQTLHLHSNGFDALQCAGNLSYLVDGDLLFPFGSDWIVYVQLNFCPAMQYSANWNLGQCSTSCGNYNCQNPLPDCDAADGPIAPALDLQLK